MLTATTSNKEMQQAPDHEREETQRQLAQFYRQALRQQAQSLDCPPPPVPALRSAPEAGAGPLPSPVFSSIPPLPLYAAGSDVTRRSLTPEWGEQTGFLFVFAREQNPDSDGSTSPAPARCNSAASDEDKDAPADVEERTVVERRGDTGLLDPPGEFPDWVQQAKHRGT